MSKNKIATVSGRRLHLKQPVFNDAGEELGAIRGFDEDGFYVQTSSQIELQNVYRNDRSGDFELLWRCWSCGELAAINALPERCPSCGAPKENLYYWTED